MLARPLVGVFALVIGCGRSDVPFNSAPWQLPQVEPTTSSDDGAPDSSTSAPDVDVDVDPCARVDLLFVVDNSDSMADEQANLVASFPGFIDGIETILGPDTDYHVGVVTTDANQHNGPGCRRLGALTNRTSGDGSSTRICGPYADGGNWMGVRDDLADSFACAAEVGIDGSGFEVPMDAIAATLHAPDQVTARCNEGFLRKGALLVLTLITDEEDDGDSLGDPEAWYEHVVAGRDPATVMVLALVGHPKPNACIPEQWTGKDGAEIATRIITFTEMFEHGRVGDICAPDYSPFFADAVRGIADACGVAIPPV